MSDKFLSTQTLLYVSVGHIFICLTSFMGIPNSMETFLKSIKSWCTASLYSHSFSSIWQMENIWSVVDLLHQNPQWWSAIISSAYGVNPDSRMVDKILYVVGKCPHKYCNLFYSLLIDRYNDRLLPFLRQFLLIPNRNNKFMDLRANCFTPLMEFDQYLVICEF